VTQRGLVTENDTEIKFLLFRLLKRRVTPYQVGPHTEGKHQWGQETERKSKGSSGLALLSCFHGERRVGELCNYRALGYRGSYQLLYLALHD
jgi:hypothetical protein